jgi:chemosensory pili system protein ChpA (sensor histidine kinase/response regulator)
MNPSTPSDDTIRESYWQEALSYLPSMRECVEALAGDATEAPLRELHRLAHTLRGASAMAGLKELSELAASTEELADEIAHGRMPLDDDAVALFRDALTQLAAGLAGETAEPPVAAPETTVATDDLPPELVDGFLVEATEILEQIDEPLRSLESQQDRAVVQEVRRGVHTIKGGAGMVGLPQLRQVAHRMEDLLDEVYEQRRAYTPAVHHLLLETYDLLSGMVQQRGGGDVHAVDAVLAQYVAAMAQTEPVPEPASAMEPEPAAAPEPEAGKFVRVPLDRLEALMRTTGELFAQRAFFERQLASYRHELDELSLSLRRLKRLSGQLDAEYAVFHPGHTGASASEFDALEFDRYTRFHLLARDLAETVNDVGLAESQLSTLAGDFESYVARQGRLTGDVQEQLTRLRLMPLSSVAARLHRTVRVAAEVTGKPAQLALEGLQVQLDKAVLEQLAGPLEHLLRNAVDHGIEAPAEREAAGKPTRGLVRLRASYEGTQVVLRLSDDGAGVRPAQLRQAAVRRGLWTEAQAAEASHEELLALLFQPSFSTAAQITEISGRGVGLDIVKNAVESLRGTITAESRPGSGLRFTIRLPLTLSITKVLLVEAEQTFAIPLASVRQVMRIEPEQVDGPWEERVLVLEEERLPLLWLSEVLGLAPAETDWDWRRPVLILEVGEDRFALLVDRIVEAREVLVKPPVGALRQARAIAGATISGEGNVVLILNPAALRQPGPVALRPPRVEALDVLVVDDSLSVRRVLSGLLRQQGWNAIPAKDGLEALEVMEQLPRVPDAIFLDVEMPRMDGFEFARAVRLRDEYATLPIIMLTSRAGEKHRRKAFDAGVDEYLVKPYQDDALLAVVRRLVESRSALP